MLNALSLYAVALVLAAAYAAQVILQELPCPLACCSASCSQRWPSVRLWQYPLRTAPQPLCDVAAGGGRRRGGVDPAGVSAHHARRRRLRRCSAITIIRGPNRLHRRHRPIARDSAVLLELTIEQQDGREQDDRRGKADQGPGIIVIAEQGGAVAGVAGHDVQQHLAGRKAAPATAASSDSA